MTSRGFIHQVSLVGYERIWHHGFVHFHILLKAARLRIYTFHVSISEVVGMNIYATDGK